MELEEKIKKLKEEKNPQDERLEEIQSAQIQKEASRLSKKQIQVDEEE